MRVDLSASMVNRLRKLAAREVWGDALNTTDDDVIVDDFAGGNVEDAYYGGMGTGETWLARKILADLDEGD